MNKQISVINEISNPPKVIYLPVYLPVFPLPFTFLSLSSSLSLSFTFSHTRLFSFRSKPPLFLVLFLPPGPLLATTRRLWETAQAGRLWPWNSRCTRLSIADLIQLNRGARWNTLARRKLDVIINTALSAWNFARTSGQCDPFSPSPSFCIYMYIYIYRPRPWFPPRLVRFEIV